MGYWDYEEPMWEPSEADELFDEIKSGKIVEWKQVHKFYDVCESEYVDYKARYALFVIEKLYGKKIRDFDTEDFEDLSKDVAFVSLNMLESSISAREKDYTDYYRNMTYRNQEEMEAVIGSLSDNSFLIQLKKDTAQFIENLENVFEGLAK